jgi:hypothetical protein
MFKILMLFLVSFGALATTVTPLTYEVFGGKSVSIPGSNISVTDPTGSIVAGLYATGSAMPVGTILPFTNTFLPTYGTTAELVSSLSLAAGTITTVSGSNSVSITATSTGTIAVGDYLTATGVPTGSIISAFGTYTTLAGTGTVVISYPATASASGVSTSFSAIPNGLYQTLTGGHVQLGGYMVSSPGGTQGCDGVDGACISYTTGAVGTAYYGAGAGDQISFAANQTNLATLDQYGHFTPSLKSTVPTLGTCSSGNSITAGGTDQNFTITFGATATSACTVNFGGTWATAPQGCGWVPLNAAAATPQTIGMYQSAISATSVTFTGTLANTKFQFQCW